MTLVVTITIVTIAITLTAAYFAYLQARSAAKPRITIDILDELIFEPAQEARLRIELSNRPYFYAQPAATNVRAYVNVNAAVEALRLLFGSGLSNSETQASTGKNNSWCLTASGIVLLPYQSERIEWYGKMPDVSGKYMFWIDVVTAEGSNATLQTALTVRQF
jgi:hypothetical protein